MKLRDKSVSALTVVLAGIALCAIQFFNPFLWFDESGQFFLGLGLNHYSDPYALRGTLQDVIVNNCAFNLDPGGFTVMTYFWTFVSTSVLFLRVLPFIFFAASVYLLYRILDHIGASKSYSVIFLGVYLIFASVFFLVAEFRAYSMEICGTLLTLLLYLKYSGNFTYKRLLVLSLVACFFCTSRYASILVAFVLTLFVLWELYRKEEFRTFIVKSMVFGIPLAATVLCIYLFVTSRQDPDAMHYVAYIGKTPSLLLSPLVLLIYLNAALLVFRHKKENDIPFILCFSLSVSILFIGLSACSLFPWDAKRAASMTLLNLVSLMVHFDYFAKALSGKKWVIFALDAAIIVCSAGLCYKLIHRGKDDIAKEFEALDLSKYENVFISYESMPDVKYQYEFGRLKDRVESDSYPDKFVFQCKLEPGPDGLDELVVTEPQDVDCDLYFNIRPPENDLFVLEDGCRHSYKKTSSRR